MLFELILIVNYNIYEYELLSDLLIVEERKNLLNSAKAMNSCAIFQRSDSNERLQSAQETCQKVVKTVSDRQWEMVLMV